MAKAPWARLTKFIKPKVTASPHASTNSSMPYATPSNRMVSRVMLLGRPVVGRAIAFGAGGCGVTNLAPLAGRGRSPSEARGRGGGGGPGAGGRGGEGGRLRMGGVDDER